MCFPGMSTELGAQPLGQRDLLCFPPPFLLAAVQADLAAAALAAQVAILKSTPVLHT